MGFYSQGSNETDMPVAFCRGLATARLHGRAQVVHDLVSDQQDSSGDLIFYLDGAHSPESMEACGRWFSSAVRGNKSFSTTPVNGYKRNGEFGRDFNRVSKQVLKTLLSSLFKGIAIELICEEFFFV